MNVSDLHEAIAAVCPIIGVSIGKTADKSTWRIDFAEHVTPEQMAAAEEALAAFDLDAVDPALVNDERERRILRGTTVTVPGVGQIPVQGRAEDSRNLQALAFAASLRMGAGDTKTPTTFHDADNVDHQLTPPQMLALWQGAAAYVSALYKASWAIKAMQPIPADFRDNDDLWPI